MARMIQLTAAGTGGSIYLNVDKIVRVTAVADEKTRVDHEPYHPAFGELDYSMVDESAQDIADMVNGDAEELPK